jgi:branched-chain amino acid transport system substrate-binding protein
VDFLVGVNGSPAAMSVAEAAKRYKKIFLSSGGAMVAGMTGKDCNRYTFRINHAGEQFYKADADYIASFFPNVKTVAGINPDYSYGHEMMEGFLAEIKKKRPDIKVVADVWVPMKEKDYTNYIATLIDKKPDLVYSVFWAGANVAFVKQAKPYGLFEKTKVYWGAAGIGTTMVTLANEMVPMWGSEPGNWQLDNPMNKKLTADFMKETGRVPHSYVAHSYGTIMIFKQAIERAKSLDTDKIIAELEGGTFDTPWGKTVIRKGDHQAMGKVFIGLAKPQSKYSFWALENPRAIPCEEVSLDVSQTGCMMK